ncbi:MAG TPA: type IV secretion system DNA-binding domain-containing protein, partial [Solirubrobacteraceae bacterium]|nr:type IV secretion system DNA-binding domain-containing protein [Solirubrobacteraceae bacterium]
ASLRAKGWRRASLPGGRGAHAGEMELGVDEHGRAVPIPCADATRADGAHTLVVGATGSGKTVTQTSIAVRAVEQGMSAVVIDPKGDARLREHLRRAADAEGRRFIAWSPEGETVYNPYAHGGASEIADKALAGERYTEPHYLRQAQRYLAHAVRTLQLAGVEVSLRTIAECLDPRGLESLARQLRGEAADAAFAYLDGLSSRQHRDLAGVRDRLAILAESDVGRWLDPQTSDAERFDLLGSIRARAVVYFDLQADGRPLLSEMLGAAIVQDLQTAVASLQNRPVPTLVAIDEFSAIASAQVVRLFGRARSAGLSLLLGTQEMSDLRLPGRERVLEQVLGNLTVLVAHRQAVPSSAELVSSMAGSRGAWRLSRHSSGASTRVRASERALEPERVMGLARGWAAVLVLGDGRPVRLVRVHARAPQR